MFNRIPIENTPETLPETPTKTLPETSPKTPCPNTYESIDSGNENPLISRPPNMHSNRSPVPASPLDTNYLPDGSCPWLDLQSRPSSSLPALLGSYRSIKLIQPATAPKILQEAQLRMLSVFKAKPSSSLLIQPAPGPALLLEASSGCSASSRPDPAPPASILQLLQDQALSTPVPET